MVSTVQTYYFNRSVRVDLAKIWELSEASRKVLTLLDKNLPPAFNTAEPLLGRIYSMEETARMLQEAKDHGVKNKVRGLLKGALVVGVVAAAATASALGGNTGTLAGCITGGVLYYILTMCFYHQAKDEILSIEKRIPGYSVPCLWEGPAEGEHGNYADACVPPLGFGCVLPAYEAFTRQSRLQRVLNEQQVSLRTALAKCHEMNTYLLPQAYYFYMDESTGLLAKLNRKIEELTQSLDAMQKFPNRSSAGEEELHSHLLAHQNAKNELKRVIEFYRQFGGGSEEKESSMSDHAIEVVETSVTGTFLPRQPKLEDID